MTITLVADDGMDLDGEIDRWFATFISRNRFPVRQIRKGEKEIFRDTVKAFIKKYGCE